ncbi:hypothetical protein BAUCODRAFT_117766 [Baudoinia panamericana UAMH 10762]|uniref:Cytochrome P450 n=1 Tax=Baudoinia panamericana (strain UAMH 10762) TaxID=717646 RepID=M2M445_BAUPA|nr:uncharacterized protein BAUCODRAFT_117766 [Baudoinia panamericana UAMH 10762]EMC91356.1 hypothetical protein BAUCODRAFT_117766 [Baudoinia panamericana UAMH 10762]
MESLGSSTFAATLVAIFLLSSIVYRTSLDSLHAIPGPLICKLTSLWTYYHSYFGDESTRIDELHKRYGPIVRIAPNEVIISDGAALAPIYVEKGGFSKAPCYANFDIEGHATIFSTQNPEYRSVRSKAVVPLFSMTSIREGQSAIESCVDRFIARLKREAAESRKANRQRPVNVLNLTRSLALDAVSSYLFGRAFGGVDEESDKLSASAFVDTLVAVGRFFFLPNWIFLTLELARQKFWPAKEEEKSAQTVGDFVESLLQGETKGTATYQARLLKAGISEHEVKIQCEDVIFAGTDSTGTSLATICWNLAKRPDVYDRLKNEVAQADMSERNQSPQIIRYLDAVVREGLRIAMPNPARLPRMVPKQGLAYGSSSGKQYFLPGGTQVGMQPYSLHFNPEVYPDPFAFRPERWLDGPTPQMQRDWIPFGMGSRQCIARNLATTELRLAVRAIAKEGALDGAQAVGEKIELMQWFNSKVKGEAIELEWQ